MDDPLSRSKVFRALVALRQQEPEHMTFGGFRKAVGYHAEEAQVLREDLLRWGLIRVEESAHGRRPFLKITLTPEGRHTADHAIEAEKWANKAREKHGKK